MKVISYISVFLCILLLYSCKKEIATRDIYGVWVMQKQSTADGPQFTKLLFDKEDYNWIDPVVSDTIFFFKKIAISGDTLLLIDGFNHPVQCVIEELHGKVLTLSHVAGFEKEITYKKVLDYSDESQDVNSRIVKASDIFKLVKASDISEDSLDVIVKSFLVWDYYQNYKKDRTYHSLSKAEVLQTKELLRRYMTDGSLGKDKYDNDDAYPFEQYIRQYESYTEKGHLYVKVTLNHFIHTEEGVGYTVLKQDSYSIEDGGPIHAVAIIDLTAKKVVYFMTNGLA